MDERLVKKLVGDLGQLQRKSTRLRFARVSDINPLSIRLSIVAGSTSPPPTFTDVRSLAGGLAVSDYVAVLIAGNDLLVLGKVT